MKQEFSTFLNMSRWLAALTVVMGHVRHIVLVDFGEVHTKNIYNQVIYFITGLGHEAVMLFFVISGFLVGGITLKRWRKSGVNFGDYFSHRISRIYTVLLPALIVGAILDILGLHYLNASELYTNSMQYLTNSLQFKIDNNLTLATFIGNLLMLESQYVPILGSNGPIWSLAYEWWYYCIFAAFAGIILRKDVPTLIICSISLVLMVTLLPLHMLVWMLIWVLGIVTYFYCESHLPKPNILLSLALFVGALTLSRINTHNTLTHDPVQPMYESFLYDFCIAGTYSLMLASLYNYKGKTRFSEIHRKLADFSYSLYLVHFPMMLIVVAFLHDIFGMEFLGQPDGNHLIYFFLLTGFLFFYAYIFSSFSEKYTYKIKATLAHLLGARNSNVSSITEVR